MREREIFLELIDLPDESARDALLARACGADRALRARVESLYRSHCAAGAFLVAPAIDPFAMHLEATEQFHGEAISGEKAELDYTLTFLDPPGRPDSIGKIGSYDVLEVLGRGGFGVVFRAFDEVLQRVVAVKVLAPHLAATSPPRKRFLREARASAAVRHENVVQVHSVVEEPLPYLVMEFIPGETLQARLERTGPLDPREVATIGRQIAAGLAAAHEQGLIHRDIKPGNIMLEAGPNGRAKITDFGLARAADDAGMTQSGLLAGTPMFMSPEQAKGEPLDHRTDLFSLGTVLYTMIAGRPPFRAPSAVAVLKRVVDDTPRPILEVIPETPAWLCNVLARLHKKNRADRYSSAREVADALAREAETPPAPSEPASTIAVATEPQAALSDRRPRSARRRVRIAAAAALVLIVAGIGFAEANGVTDLQGSVIRLFFPEGTLIVEVDDPDVSVSIDEDDLVIKGAGVKEIRLEVGRHTLLAKKDGKLVRRELVDIVRNGRRIVRVTEESGQGPAEGPVANAHAPDSAETAAWLRVVAALPAADQAKAVAAALKERNPDFSGTVVPTIENGIVRGLELDTHDVHDLSPLRALTKLRRLWCRCEEPNGELADLSPLAGLPLQELIVTNSSVADLTPLKGMTLKRFMCESTKVRDLSPLSGMPLEEFRCGFTRVSDLSPLKGMKLSICICPFSDVSDLSPLEGMPLVELDCPEGVKDLSVLKGMPLTNIACAGPVSDLSPLKGKALRFLVLGESLATDLTPLQGMTTLRHLAVGRAVRDLSPLKGLALEYLDAGAVATDLSPLAGMPLRSLTVGPKALDLALLAAMPLEHVRLSRTPSAADAKILRAIPTLKTINEKPAAEVLKEVDAPLER